MTKQFSAVKITFESNKTRNLVLDQTKQHVADCPDVNYTKTE